jgi:hypothetical protein
VHFYVLRMNKSSCAWMRTKEGVENERESDVGCSNLKEEGGGRSRKWKRKSGVGCRCGSRSPPIRDQLEIWTVDFDPTLYRCHVSHYK